MKLRPRTPEEEQALCLPTKCIRIRSGRRVEIVEIGSGRKELTSPFATEEDLDRIMREPKGVTL